MRHRAVAAALAGLVLSFGSACAGVPQSGPISIGRPVAAVGGALAEVPVREVPAGPPPGASPVQLVSGFLRAMLDSDGGYGVARSYLAPGAKWSSGGDVTIYADPSRVVRTGHSSVLFQARQIGVLGTHGLYRFAPGAISRHFQVVRRGGEWRLARLDNGILLSSDDAGRLLQPAALYFLNPGGDRVVPQPVLERPQEPGLATVLVRELLAGPGPLLGPGVRTAVPLGTTLVGNVPISPRGIADVDLSAGIRQVAPAQLERLSAQIVWTLRQLSSVTAVRLLANGVPLEAPGVSSLQPVASWAEFDPAPPPAARGAWSIRRGNVVGLGAAVPPTLRGPGTVAATRSADGEVVAAIRRAGSGEQLLIGAGGRRLRVALRRSAITAATFGADDSVIVSAAGGQLYVVAPSGQPHPAPLGGRLRAGAVRAMALSPDGTRLALVEAVPAGSELDVVTVVRSGSQLTLRKPRVVLPASSQVASVAWAGATQIVTTVAIGRGVREVVEVGPDGFQPQDLSGPGLPADLDEVAASPGQRVLAADRAGTWQLVGRRWRKVSDATAPSYAGG